MGCCCFIKKGELRFVTMIQFVLLFSRQGKLRLQKWFDAYQDNYKKKICRELIWNILGRKPKMCSFIEWKDLKIVYKRYASLYFCAAIDVRPCGTISYSN